MTTTETTEDRASGAKLWMIVLGVLAIILGAIGFLMIPGLTIASVIWYGALFIVLGIALIAESLVRRPRRWGHTILGALYVVAGALIAFEPFRAAVAITLLIGLLLIVVGVGRALWSFRLHGMAKWIGLVGAALSIVLGIMILMQWPSSSAWVMGLFIAVDLIFYGTTALTLAFAKRRL